MSSQARILIVGAYRQVGRELQRNFFDVGKIINRDRDAIDSVIADQVRSMICNVTSFFCLVFCTCFGVQLSS
jgi:hypothetical protein